MNINQEDIDTYYSELNKSYVQDGIISIDEYSSSPKKILWILKEPHSKEKDKSWDHRGFLGWSMIDSYPRWYVSMGPVTRTSFAIHNNINDFSKVKRIRDFGKEEIYSQMRSIAFINVKKNVGSTTSDYRIINQAYKDNKDMILKQIEMINPDIIINCSRVWDLFCDLVEDEKVSKEDDLHYAQNKGRTVIHSFHPQASSKKIEPKILSILEKKI